MFQDVEIRHGHFFCGLGGGGKGFNKARPVVGNKRAKFRCIGGIDVDAPGIRDFTKLTGVAGTVLDMFDLEQYIAFHGRTPPPDWRPATTADIHRAFNNEHPHIIFLSAPCKGFSGLLSQVKSLTDKYQALNRLTLRGIWMMLEAYKDDPVELIVFENVPRIATRGRHLLDQIMDLLRAYGYAVAETTHDCGELGGLGQSRKRFLLVARHIDKVPPFLYEPPKKSLRAVGDILGKMLLPGDERAGPMHRIPALQWKTWVRLAFVEAGSDWRSLNKLQVENGHLSEYLIMPQVHSGMLGVNKWEENVGTITSRSMPNNGNFAVADPRQELYSSGMGVVPWADHVGAVAGESMPSNGKYAVADPRKGDIEKTHKNVARVVEWGSHAGTVTSGHGPSSGGQSVADPRFNQSDKWKDGQAYGVHAWNEHTGAIPGQQSPGQGAYSVADPRRAEGRAAFSKYAVTPWLKNAGTVISGDDSGAYAVSDPRHGGPAKHSNEFRIVPWEKNAQAVTSAHGTGQAVADPRGDGPSFGKYKVTAFTGTAGTVISGSTTGEGAFAVADPRNGVNREKGDNYLTAGHYGVIDWKEHAGAVSAAAGHDNGRWSVGDPRSGATGTSAPSDVPENVPRLPALNQKIVCRIQALDGTWHRPFTTLELAALQSLVDPEEMLELDGLSDQAWRERIGNAVPPDAAQAIAEVMGTTLLLAWSGETFMLSAQPIWVQPLVIGLSVDQRGNPQ
ncbi:MAG: DNA cytosine methyltransferase [Pseudomonadota bacterium]